MAGSSQLARSHGPDICAALPGFHAFSGCDSVSALGQRGKKVGYKLLTGRHGNPMKLLGNSLTVSDGLHGACEQFVCKLYGKTSMLSVDDLRYDLFCQVSRTFYAEMPSTQDALRQHTNQSNFQAHLWKTCLRTGSVAHPNGHGWSLEGDKLSITWELQAPAPSALLPHILVHCSCNGGCSSSRCKCYREKVKCTDICTCSTVCSQSSRCCCC